MFQQQHAMLPVGTHDELSRQAFCASLRGFFTTELWPANREVYEGKLLPRFKADHGGREPASHREVSDLMGSSYYYKASSLIGRTAQEMVWDVVGDSIERQIDALVERAKPKDSDLGTVRTNPDLPMPRYIEAVDIHVQPGNFHTELGQDDVFAGVLYDRGVHVFSYGGLGPRNENYGEAVAAMIKQQFPDLKPLRILDLGTGIGNIALPLARAFPEAEVHGVDIGAPMVRYSHARAESLGVKAHFSQQDAAHMDFPDGHFDVVVSMLLTHECPVPVLRHIFKEAHRVLKPGGFMMHDGMFKRPPRPPIEELLGNWFGPNANEPFSAGFRRLDFAEAFEQAGFAPHKFFTGSRPPVYLQGYLPDINFLGAVK